MLKFNFKHSKLLNTASKLFGNHSKYRLSSYYSDSQKFTLSEKELKHPTPVQSFIYKYRKYGHHYSDLDPLGLLKKDPFPSASEFSLNADTNIEGQIEPESYLAKKGIKTVKELEEFLKHAYTGKVGVEFEHVVDAREREWLYNRFEELLNKDLNENEQTEIFQLITESEALDHFLHRKFQTFKRYSGEGTETLQVALNTIFAKASAKGVEEVIIGMPHRGRLNTLVRLLDYPARELFYKISGKNDVPEELYTAIDDVVSHIAVTNKRIYASADEGGDNFHNNEIKLSLLHNPSHLEAVNPVAMGKARAKQDDAGSSDRVLCLLVHGDAAFAGQGIIYESFCLSGVPSFTPHGIVHIICNNQIGYTTVPREGRTSMYSSDICKMNGVPVVHVNADHPEEVFKVAQLAVEYRQKFKKDFMIDLIGYRRYGHNELDEPEFTQPLMYRQIRTAQPSSPKKYHEYLVSKGVCSPEDYNKIREAYFAVLEKEFDERNNVKKTIENLKNPEYKGAKSMTGKWSGMDFSQYGKEGPTGISADAVKNYVYASINVPPTFNVHPRIQKYHIQHRISQIEKDLLDWPAAEAAALASLIDEGYNVRFSGQDVERGTFSHRHLVLTDIKTEEKWVPLREQSESFAPQGRFDLVNSPLSEAGVMGFEYGYSIESPRNVVIWEAQFGDFFNPAQVVIDTFVTCSESKWLRQNGLVLLLPHGMDGTGPEHSSCRIERFLQMGASDGLNRLLKLKDHDPNRKRLDVADPYFYENHQDVNFQFAIPTTPANYFHILRRQYMRNFRKPLIIASPKILLKHPQAKSTVQEFTEGTKFNPFYVHTGQCSLEDAEVAFFCSGKISYDIKAFLKNNPELEKKAVLFTIEELLPFPEKELKAEMQKLKKTCKIAWVQEESLNNGAYFYTEPRLNRIAREIGLEDPDVYAHARRAIATTATGNGEHHAAETKALFNSLLRYK